MTNRQLFILRKRLKPTETQFNSANGYPDCNANQIAERIAVIESFDVWRKLTSLQRQEQ